MIHDDIPTVNQGFGGDPKVYQDIMCAFLAQALSDDGDLVDKSPSCVGEFCENEHCTSRCMKKGVNDPYTKKSPFLSKIHSLQNGPSDKK